MIAIVPDAVALKTVGYNPLISKYKIHQKELMANLPNKAEYILMESWNN